jgi:mannose-1-phosphate guanylyltransferase/mannose-6-phosphate isomerase
LGEAAESAARAAGEGYLVCFGVPPQRAETGYGYIEKGERIDGCVFRVARFTEKPDRETAGAFVAAGTYWWNSGIFLFRASRYLEELARFAPDMHAACAAAWAARRADHEFLRFEEASCAAIPSGSIDYTVMEHTDRAAVAPFARRWNDLGSWAAFYEESGRDAAGNALVGDVIVRDTTDSYIHSEHRLVAALGVSGLAVVETADAVLVMRREESQGVRDILACLKAAGRAESDTHRTVFRPWGNYEVLAASERFQVKRIVVNPGAALSSQYHHHRAEHWVVVRGTAKITNGEETFLLREDESTYIPLGAVHRLENPGLMPLEIIEVQTGSYLGEDDIIRLEDSYGRN